MQACISAAAAPVAPAACRSASTATARLAAARCTLLRAMFTPRGGAPGIVGKIAARTGSLYFCAAFALAHAIESLLDGLTAGFRGFREREWCEWRIYEPMYTAHVRNHVRKPSTSAHLRDMLCLSRPVDQRCGTAACSPAGARGCTGELGPAKNHAPCARVIILMIKHLLS